MATNDELLIQIKADIQDVKQKMGDATKEVKKVGASATATGKEVDKGFGAARTAVLRFAAPAVIGLAIIKTASMALEAARAADAIGKMSAALGLSAESYQELTYAMNSAGVGQAGLDMGMRTLNRLVGEAQRGNVKATQTFQELGISMDEVRTSSPEQMFHRAIDALGGVDNAQKRAAFSAELLGAKNVKMNGIIEAGTESLKAKAKEAHRVGAVLSNELVAAAEETTDRFDQMRSALGTNMQNALLQGFRGPVNMAADSMEWLNTKIAEFLRNRQKIEDLGEIDLELRLEQKRAEFDEKRNASGFRGANKYDLLMAQREKDPSGQSSNEAFLNEVDSLASEVRALERQLEIKRNEATKAAEEERRKLRQESIDNELADIRRNQNLIESEYTESMNRLNEIKASSNMTDEEYNREKVAIEKKRLDAITAQNATEIKLMEEQEKARAEQREKERLAAVAYHEREMADAEFRSKQKEAQANKEDEALEAFQALLDPIGALSDELDEWMELIRAATDDTYLLAAAEEYRAKKLKEAMEEQTDLQKRLAQLADGVGFEFTSAFEDAVLGGEKLRVVLQGLAEDLTRLLMRKLILDQLAAGLSAGISNMMGGGSQYVEGSNNFVGPPRRAGGGHVNPSMGAIEVGERGRELFVPPSVGRIIPNHLLNGGGGGNVKVEIVNKGTPVEAVSSSATMSPKGIVVSIITEDMRKGGPISSGMASLYGLQRKR